MYQILIYEQNDSGNHLIYASAEISEDKKFLANEVLARHLGDITDNMEVTIQSTEHLEKIRCVLIDAVTLASVSETGFYEDELFAVQFAPLEEVEKLYSPFILCH
jgi:hypothetical protein